MKAEFPGQFAAGPERPTIPPLPTPIRIGNEAHKSLFCSTRLDTFNPYKPRVLDWPRLDEQAHARVTGLPIWDIAVETENKASLRMNAALGFRLEPAWLGLTPPTTWEEFARAPASSSLDDKVT